MHTYTFIHTVATSYGGAHVYMCINVYICMNVCVCMCVCVCAYRGRIPELLRSVSSVLVRVSPVLGACLCVCMYVCVCVHTGAPGNGRAHVSMCIYA